MGFFSSLFNPKSAIKTVTNAVAPGASVGNLSNVVHGGNPLTVGKGVVGAVKDAVGAPGGPINSVPPLGHIGGAVGSVAGALGVGGGSIKGVIGGAVRPPSMPGTQLPPQPGNTGVVGPAPGTATSVGQAMRPPVLQAAPGHAYAGGSQSFDESGGGRVLPPMRANLGDSAITTPASAIEARNAYHNAWNERPNGGPRTNLE